MAGYKPPGPVTSSPNSYIKLSFKEGGETEVSYSLTKAFTKGRAAVWLLTTLVFDRWPQPMKK